MTGSVITSDDGGGVDQLLESGIPGEANYHLILHFRLVWAILIRVMLCVTYKWENLGKMEN